MTDTGVVQNRTVPRSSRILHRALGILAFSICAAGLALADLPDAASALARIQASRAETDAKEQMAGPSLRSLYIDYLALPLDAPPAREAEGWFALVDLLLKTKDYDSLSSLSCGTILSPFFFRLPSAEAWPAIRNGLSERAAATTNAVPLLDALRLVFDKLAHDEAAASNTLARLRAAAPGQQDGFMADIFRELEGSLKRKSRLPRDVMRYFLAIAEDDYGNIEIPQAFLNLPPDRLWQLTAPALTNELKHLDRSALKGDSNETHKALMDIAQTHRDVLAAAPGFSLVDHTPAGRELYEYLLGRFDFLAAAADIAARPDDEDDKGDDGDEEDDEDETDVIEKIADGIDEGLSANALAEILARVRRQGRDGKPEGYGDFRSATMRVLRGVLARDGLQGACDFAARFPTNFFRDVELPFTDGGVAEMDFIERFVLGDTAPPRDGMFCEDETGIWESYSDTAMLCGQTARARALIDRVRAKGPWSYKLFGLCLDLAAFDDDEAAITALSREFREHLPPLLRTGGREYPDMFRIARELHRIANILVATTNRAELAAYADLMLSADTESRKQFTRVCGLGILNLEVFEAVGLADRAFDIAVAFSRRDSSFALYDAIMPLYRSTGRHGDIVAIIEGDPEFPATNALQFVESAHDGLMEAYAEALAKTGRGADAAAIARYAALLTQGKYPCDWPFRILVDEMEPGAFIELMDAMYAADRYEERPLIWKAEALRRAGRLEEAESVARKAVETDPTDGETRAGDRIRSYSVLADILEARGKADDASFLRSAVKAVRLAEEGDDLQDCGLVRRSLAKYEEAESHFSAAYCVQWREAERLRALGQTEAAARHYEETFRQLPTQFGFVASLCFGCAGIFDSPGIMPAAERILTEAASAKTPAPAACYLLGQLREKQGRHEEAFEAYARAVTLAPEYLDALVAQNNLRYKVRRPIAVWERIQARILELDPLGRHSDFDESEILDWGLAKSLESAAMRKLPAADLTRLRAISIHASAAKARESAAKDGPRRSGSETIHYWKAFHGNPASKRKLGESDLVDALSLLLGAIEGDTDYRYRSHHRMYSGAAAYDDLVF